MGQFPRPAYSTGSLNHSRICASSRLLTHPALPYRHGGTRLLEQSYSFRIASSRRCAAQRGWLCSRKCSDPLTARRVHQVTSTCQRDLEHDK